MAKAKTPSNQIEETPEIQTPKPAVTLDMRQKLRQDLRKFGDGKVGKDILCFLKSRYKLLYICSNEEQRIIKLFKQISLSEGYDLFHWDCSRGLLDVHGMKQVKSANNEVHTSPVGVLSYIVDCARSDNAKLNKSKDKGKSITEGRVFLLLDFHVFLGCDTDPELQRKFRELSGLQSMCFVVVVAPSLNCPVALEKEFTVIDFPYPSKDEIRESFDLIKQSITSKYVHVLDTAKEKEEDLLSAASGLTVAEAENAYALSLVKKKNFDIPTILDEKKQAIRKTGVLEYRDPRFTFDDVGGLDNLKEWLRLRRGTFGADAKAFGIDTIKGILLCGTPGCGKSMVCEALASYWEMPLLRLDMGAVFSSHVGDSERNMRQEVIKVAESIAPAILFVDEIEKGIGGVQSSNQTDGGVTNRVFGTFLTWLQEKQSPVFVVCTANNVLGIPPEFMRAGRFDEIFFVDLPNLEQRIDVTAKLLLRRSRNPDDFDLDKIAAESENYSPAEIEKAINNGLFVAYSQSKRLLTTADIVTELKKFQPLFNTRHDEVEAMREWALGSEGKGGFAMLANSVDDGKDFSVASAVREIEVDDELVL